jgi:hypothetical protein
LAVSVNLPADADYCSIVDEFADTVKQFLDDVRHKTSVAMVAPGRISFAG